ncbi:hypothetical protein P0L94_03545 [Microbacter sp. GSS18]|nr:hypothetical protein P0L94_03545 [Microbacter sp. GSS18]
MSTVTVRGCFPHRHDGCRPRGLQRTDTGLIPGGVTVMADRREIPMSRTHHGTDVVRGLLRTVGVTALIGLGVVAGAAAADARPSPHGSVEEECARIVLWDGKSILSCTDEQGLWPPLT